LLLVFASTVIPGFSLLSIHDQDFYSLLDMHVFRNGGLLFDEGGAGVSMQALRLLNRSFSTSISVGREPPFREDLNPEAEG
jgi:hypothetical protein